MHNIEDMLVEKNYSKCPLKKRPINYQFVKDDFDKKDNKVAEDLLIKSHTIAPTISEEPENLSLKKDSSLEHKPVVMVTEEDEELINVSDCCEDEGVDVDHTDEDSSLFEEDEEMIDCVEIEDNNGADANTTQAAALAAAAAVAAASAAAAAAASVVVPTPTYPKYGLQPWNFHMSPYTAEFYRTINTPHMAQQISPLRGDLLSPSSPSDSLSSLSPPPPHHYMPGRASSVSPPMRSEIIHRPIGVRHLPPSPPQQQQQTQQQQHQHHQHTVHHRFIHYPLTPYPTHPHQTNPTTAAAYALGYTSHHAPISPAYSESSYYSMRSLTPESLVSSVPEDLSIKHNNSKTGTKLLQKSLNNQQKSTEVKEKLVATPAIIGSPATTGSATKKDKSTPPRYQCPDCQKSYSTFSGLTKHQQFHCPAAEGNQVKKSFSCKDCDKTYVSLGALKMHIRTHTLPCKCNICGKAFSRPWLLQGHIRTHTGEKPFSCQHCHRAFADRSNLRAHLQTHSDIKKYSCSNCSKTFSRMSLLTKHSEGGCQANNMNNNNIDSPVTIASELNPYALYVDH